MRRAALLPLLLAGATASAQAPAAAPDSASSAEAGVVRLTVDEAVTRAVAVSPRLLRLSALETAAEAQARGARAERCTRVALVNRGRLLTVEAPDALRAGERGVMVEVVAEPRRAAVAALRGAPGVAEVEVFGERLHASLPDEAPARAAEVASLLASRLREAGLDVRSARPTTPSLEDVFIGRIRDREATADVEVNP